MSNVIDLQDTDTAMLLFERQCDKLNVPQESRERFREILQRRHAEYLDAKALGVDQAELDRIQRETQAELMSAVAAT
jgi:hypothetical protein